MGATHFSGPVVSDLGFVGPAAMTAKAAATDGALDVSTGMVVLTKGSAGAYTLAAPAASDDGKIVIITAGTAFAHTITQTTPGFNGLGGSGDLATFAAAVGNGMTLVAYGGKWVVTNNTGVTLS